MGVRLPGRGKRVAKRMNRGGQHKINRNTGRIGCPIVLVAPALVVALLRGRK